MKCPFCSAEHDRVVDSRESRGGRAIRRRRECLTCSRRYTTYERIEEIPYFVVKRDGSRVDFDRNKLILGLRKACEKRPIPAKRLDEVVDAVEQMLHETEEREITTEKVGRFVMEQLRDLDQVAYVRFASVYRKFEDIDAFMAELKDLLNRPK